MPNIIELSPAGINMLLNGPDGPVSRMMMRRGLLVEAEAKRRCPVNHGRLRVSITHRYINEGHGLTVIVGTNVHYAAYVHNGTGVFGVWKTPIVPRRAKVLRFVGKDGDIVFRPYVSGQDAKPFLKEALEAVLLQE